MNKNGCLFYILYRFYIPPYRPPLPDKKKIPDVIDLKLREKGKK
jgi:hypothetical protein